VSPIAPVLERLSGEIAALTTGLGRPVDVAALDITDRDGELALGPPGRISCNRACRLVRGADGWIAVNLARAEDQELVPAWLHGEGDDWDAIERCAARRTVADLIGEAILLGLPAARVGEAASNDFAPPRICYAPPSAAAPRIRVFDLSVLWAGPLCGAILAAVGADVTRVENRRRPDRMGETMPGLFSRLNGAKAPWSLDFGDPGDLKQLRDAVATADIIVTNARPRVFPALGLEPERVFARNPRLVWIAVTGHGWRGAAGQRVGFGDDTAAAGGLVRWTDDGEPRFLGDALSDPVTGLTAAIVGLRALDGVGGGELVDVSMAACAAAAAHKLRAEARG